MNGKPDTEDGANQLIEAMRGAANNRCMNTYKDKQFLNACVSTDNIFLSAITAMASAHIKGKIEGTLTGLNQCEFALTVKSNSILPKAEKIQVQTMIEGLKANLGLKLNKNQTLQAICDEYGDTFNHSFIEGPLVDITLQNKVPLQSLLNEARSFQDQFSKQCAKGLNGLQDTKEDAAKLIGEMKIAFEMRCRNTYQDNRFYQGCLNTAKTFDGVLTAVASMHSKGKAEGTLIGLNQCETTLTAKSNTILPKAKKAIAQTTIEGLKSALAPKAK